MFEGYNSMRFPHVTDGANCHQQFFLETIVEESSDELCSESDKSGQGGWNSDSDADSVIHVPKLTGTFHDTFLNFK